MWTSKCKVSTWDFHRPHLGKHVCAQSFIVWLPGEFPGPREHTWNLYPHRKTAKREPLFLSPQMGQSWDKYCTFVWDLQQDCVPDAFSSHSVLPGCLPVHPSSFCPGLLSIIAVINTKPQSTLGRKGLLGWPSTLGDTVKDKCPHPWGPCGAQWRSRKITQP